MNRFTTVTFALIPLVLTVGCSVKIGNSSPNHSGVIDAQRSALRTPGDSASWCDLGDAYASAQEFSLAQSTYAGVVQMGVDTECAEEGLESLGGMGWLSQIEQMVLANPVDDELWGDLGDSYSSDGDTDSALAAYMYAMTLDPEDGEWHGKISDISGESVEEIRAAASAEILATYEAQLPQHQEDDEWLGDYGDLLMQVGREEEACDLYATAMALDPQDYEWIGNVAECNGEPSPENGYDMGHGSHVGSSASDETVMDFSTDPTYGEVTLEIGFEPDPHSIEVIAGGDTHVSIAGCTGHVLTTAPDVRLQYSAGENFEEGFPLPLSIYVSSLEDTVLFVNMPDGEWLCNDDTQATNPAITLAEPMEGQYDIWVGTYNADSNAMGNLMISEYSDIQWSVGLEK